MKKIKFLTLATILTLVFTSCSNEESLPSEVQNTNLSKTYKLKRDATGAYSVYSTDNTQIDRVLTEVDNTKLFFLSNGNSQSNKNSSQELLIDNNKLKIGFIDANTNDKQLLTILDDNISLQSKNNNKKLADYSIQGNQDGTYDLDFKVNNNVDVSFVYNEEISTYEIHLEKGKGGVENFSRTLEREDGGVLRVDFVNHINNSNAKSSEESSIRKPIIIISD
jgi:PBP1b-binding outer membrane lipoprotein LpoB